MTGVYRMSEVLQILTSVVINHYIHSPIYNVRFLVMKYVNEKKEMHVSLVIFFGTVMPFSSSV